MWLSYRVAAAGLIDLNSNNNLCTVSSISLLVAFVVQLTVVSRVAACLEKLDR